MSYSSDVKSIDERGFAVVGAANGGWIVVDPPSRDMGYPMTFWRAFSTFDEMLAWLGSLPRSDKPDPAAEAMKGQAA